MLKETLISVISILIIVIGNNVSNSFTSDTLGEVTSQLSELREQLVEENNDEVSSKINDIYDGWEEKYDKLAYIIEHDELEKVEEGLTKIRSNIEMDETNEAVVDLDSTMFIIGHIEDKVRFKLENIF